MNPTQARHQVAALRHQLNSMLSQVQTLEAGLEEINSAPEIWVGTSEFLRLAGIGKTKLYELWGSGKGPYARFRGGVLEMRANDALNRDTWSHHKATDSGEGA